MVLLLGHLLLFLLWLLPSHTYISKYATNSFQFTVLHCMSLFFFHRTNIRLAIFASMCLCVFRPIFLSLVARIHYFQQFDSSFSFSTKMTDYAECVRVCGCMRSMYGLESVILSICLLLSLCSLL